MRRVHDGNLCRSHTPNSACLIELRVGPCPHYCGYCLRPPDGGCMGNVVSWLHIINRTSRWRLGGVHEPLLYGAFCETHWRKKVIFHLVCWFPCVPLPSLPEHPFRLPADDPDSGPLHEPEYVSGTGHFTEICCPTVSLDIRVGAPYRPSQLQRRGMAGGWEPTARRKLSHLLRTLSPNSGTRSAYLIRQTVQDAACSGTSIYGHTDRVPPGWLHIRAVIPRRPSSQESDARRLPTPISRFDNECFAQ